MAEKNLNNEELRAEAALSENAIANKTGTVCATALCVILALAYLLEYFKGARTLGYSIFVFIACIAPAVIAWIIYKRTPDAPEAIMRTLGIGFTVMYSIFIFTSNNVLVFTYVMPMLLILMIFNKKAFIMIIGIGAVVENIIAVVIDSIRNGGFAAKSATYEIQILLVLLCVIFFITVNRTYDNFATIRAARLSIEKNKISDILSKVLGISGDITEEVDSVHTKVGTLMSSMENTLNAMQEVSSGNNETAEAVQNQLHKTEEIQDNINSVKSAADIISSNMTKADTAVDEGRKHIKELESLTEESEKAGEDVAKALEQFQEYTGQMNSITAMINSVASQTSLLSLNASIEAARAGEAGRGFAVVASEISSLAAQTTNATNDINDLINNISEQLGVMVDEINRLIESNKQQSETAVNTANSFNVIAETVQEISTETVDMGKSIDELAEANEHIVNTIQTLSAISEEVSAHSHETYSSSERNQGVLNEVNELVELLNSNAEMLKNASE